MTALAATLTSLTLGSNGSVTGEGIAQLTCTLVTIIYSYFFFVVLQILLIFGTHQISPSCASSSSGTAAKLKTRSPSQVYICSHHSCFLSFSSFSSFIPLCVSHYVVSTWSTTKGLTALKKLSLLRCTIPELLIPQLSCTSKHILSTMWGHF
jgi:hypothetical protein